MKKRLDICKTAKCSHLNLEENKCSFNDCIFTTAELKIKAEIAENNEFCLIIMKAAAATALICLIMLCLYNKMGWI